MKKSNDKKGYWVAKANVNSLEKQQNYGKLAEAVLEKFKGKFLIRGGRQVTKEGEEYMRNVVVEFPSYKDAVDAYESKEYQDALKVLDGGADRLYAVVEGYWLSLMFYFLLLAWLMASYMALFSSRMKDSPLKPYGWSIWFVVTVIVLGSLISEWVR